MTPGPIPAPVWAPLSAAIAGEVALPGSPAYELGFRGFNARFHHRRPQAIVRCAAPEDVAETVTFLARHGFGHATRSGGHCFGGRSSTHGVVIDVTPMHAVGVSAGTATVGAGARLGEVYEALGEHDVTVPGGTCPAVGVAGLVLGGGLGILGRTHGVTSDRLVGAQIVLADGRILDCDEHRHADLFWALRGAGAGSFGVVTSLVLATVPAPPAANVHLRWRYGDAAAVIDAWQRWAPDAPDELAASLKVTAAGDVDQPPSVDLYSAFFGTESDAHELLERLVARAASDPLASSSRYLSYEETRGFWAALGTVEQVGGATSPPEARDQQYLTARSEYFGRPLPIEVITALVDGLGRDRSALETRELDFMPWGGAYNRLLPAATAFVHRDERFLLKHAVVTEPEASASEADRARRWVSRSWATVHPWGSGGVFQNFADPDLEHWAEAYYGSNLPRLVRVKTRYDPGDVFRSPQSLPVR